MTNESTSRKYGVEIEFTGISQQAAVDALNAAGVRTEFQSYNHRTCPVWKVVTDSSCGLEAVSPILQGEDGLQQIARVCDALAAAGARVNKNTAYHVHLDVSDFRIQHARNLVKLWVKFEDVFDTFQPASRRLNENRYCQSNILPPYCYQWNGSQQATYCGDQFELIDRCQTMEDLGNLYPSRFMKLNVQAYFRHRTIEVRHHSGTLNAEKATNWVRLLLEFYETARTAKAVRVRPSNAEVGLARHKWFFQRTSPKNLRRFYAKRAKQLMPLAA